MHDFGKLGYEAYARQTGGKTFDGRTMPVWDALPEGVRGAWRAAAQAIRVAICTVRDPEGAA